MEPILIAHLSDLHFGEGDSNAVWDALVTYINDTLKPHLVLVTGDVVNTPDAALFRRAKEQLDRLRPRSTPEDRYRLCPGNHDRFWLGNSAGKPGFWARMLGGNDEARNLTRPAHGELENFFKGGLVLTPEFPFDVTLPSGTDQQKGGNSWKLRILGGDSCEEDTYFAQGLLNTKAISDLRATALGDTTVDLVILLVHHHLLPIASLEKEQPDLHSLANVTGMLNAGTALNMLAASHVNLVLHGHEHHPQASRFRTYDAVHGEVAVVATGSSTGTRTLKGWSMKHARFNVVELRPDRSVVLREINGEKGYFAEGNDAPVQLLNAEDVRRARFQRKATKAGARNPPRSRVTKLFEFRHDRDGVITETRTDWLIGDRWVISTQNRTGTPTTANLEMHFGDGQRLEMSADFARTGFGDNSYTAAFDLGAQGGRSVNRVITSWSWEAGAVLTLDELATIRDPGEFRNDKKEFASVEAPESDLEELTLVVKVPQEFAPDYRSIEVWTANVDTRKWEPNASLRHLVEPLGQGLFSLRVPFPLPRWRYAMCWPLAPGPGEGETRWVQHLTANAAGIHEAICNSLYGKDGLPDDASVALYLRRPGGKGLYRAQSKGKALEALDFDEQSGIVRGAWWGRRLRATAPEENDSSGLFVDGDSYVALFPLVQPGVESFPAAGLIRVAVRGRFPGLGSGDGAQVEALRSVLARSPVVWYQ
jgi:UDP-2,3-diacylglucosamine pyrophosphatase LpxH